MKNRLFALAVTFVVCFLFVMPQMAMAEYPEKEIRIICASGDGGGVDRMSRSVQRFLPDILGATVLVENRKGAGGKIAMSYFLKQPADGYTLFTFHQPGITNMIKQNPELVSIDDLAIININWLDPAILLARKDLGWKNFEDFYNAAKANPGKYSLARPVATAAESVMTLKLFQDLGLDIKILPYQGGGEARAAMMGGHADMCTGGSQGMLPAADDAYGIAIYNKTPVPYWPDTKPINDQVAKYNYHMPDVGPLRLFAVKKEFKEKYPERFEKLVNAFHKLVTEYQPFIDFCDKQDIGHQWYGPEESSKMVKETDEVFKNIDVQ